MQYRGILVGISLMFSILSIGLSVYAHILRKKTEALREKREMLVKKRLAHEKWLKERITDD